MAYDGNKLSIIAATIEGVFNTGVYIGTDPIETVTGANYISDGQKRGLPLGCTVWYFDGTDVFDCFVSAVEAAPGFGVTLAQISGGGGTFDLTITDGTHTVANVDHILFAGGPVVSGTSPNGVVTITIPPPADAGIIPESGPTPVKISAFTSPSEIGPVGFATGIFPDGDDFINVNFTQLQLLSGRPDTGDSVYGIAGSSDGTSGSYAGVWEIRGGTGLGTGAHGGAVHMFAGGANTANGVGGSASMFGGQGDLGGGVGVQAGNTADGTAGSAVLGAGYATGLGDGGNVYVRAGDAGNGTGGDVQITAGLGYVAGGGVSIVGGSGGNVAGGVSITAGGMTSLTGNGAAMYVSSGVSLGDTYTSGGVTLKVGQAQGGGDGGKMYLLGGDSPGSYAGLSFYSGTGGLIEVRAGGGGEYDSPSTGHGAGGNLHLYSGFATGSGFKSGDIILRVGNAAAGATKGTLFIRNLPTSSAGLTSGGVWLNSNVMTVVP